MHLIECWTLCFAQFGGEHTDCRIISVTSVLSGRASHLRNVFSRQREVRELRCAGTSLLAHRWPFGTLDGQEPQERLVVQAAAVGALEGYWACSARKRPQLRCS